LKSRAADVAAPAAATVLNGYPAPDPPTPRRGRANAPRAARAGIFARELTYMRARSTFTGVQLVNGTRPFRADLVAAVLNG
jgi:hypothetical protein